MSGTKAKMRFSLKAGERIFINGAVLTVNQRVTLSLLNDARFLLESHVLQVKDATTPMRQLYFVAQALLIDPSSAKHTNIAFRELHSSLMATHHDEEVREALVAIQELVASQRTFEALKMIRALFDADDELREKSATISAHHVA